MVVMGIEDGLRVSEGSEDLWSLGHCHDVGTHSVPLRMPETWSRPGS